jgi:hypothetical protein
MALMKSLLQVGVEKRPTVDQAIRWARGLQAGDVVLIVPEAAGTPATSNTTMAHIGGDIPNAFG